MHACKRSFVGARGKRSPFPGSFSPTETQPDRQGRCSNDARCGRGRATRPLHLQCSRNFISPPSASACLEALCGETKVPTARFASPATLNGRELRPRTKGKQTEARPASTVHDVYLSRFPFEIGSLSHLVSTSLCRRSLGQRASGSKT